MTRAVIKERPSSAEVLTDAMSLTVEAAHREKAKSAHPDKGGDAASMAELNAAREEAKQALVA